MDKYILLSKKSANPKKLPLEKSKNPAYRIVTVAKNSGQDWKPELQKMPSCIFILNGFFYACDKIRWVMTDCREEPSGSPFSFVTVFPILYSLSPLRLETKLTVSHLQKESAYV